MTVPPSLSDLPIAALLPEIAESLARRSNLVLEAPPGAGKTTGVPLALLAADWLGRGKIVVLEPRRLATRSAARRMAALLGESVGETVGYRVRLESRVSARTRIEIVTDGIFTRMIQDDPALEGTAVLIFDEFHERRLETDLGLALALEAQSALRPDLRLIVMSATLEAGPVAQLMNDAPCLRAAGRAFPVTVHHLPAPKTGALASAILDTIERALGESGDILVFLPGAREIRHVQRIMAATLPGTIDILPLYGDLDQAAQDRALAPAAPGRRKIILATSIAETSLTIDGVMQVIDSGLARQSRFDPRTGMARLETIPTTQAGATQRAGRAGRTGPGHCWRLWPEASHRGLKAAPAAEILLADLAPMALELASWGVLDPNAMRLLDPPPSAAFDAARRLLGDLAALDADGRITQHGAGMARLGLSPRLAHMVLRAKERDCGVLGCAIAAVLSERDGGDERSADLRSRLERLPRDPAFARSREIAKRLCRQVGAQWSELTSSRAGEILALAYPDRVAQRRGIGGRFLLSGGQGAFLPEADPLAAENFLAIAELDGQSPDSRIWLAAPLTQEALEDIFADQITLIHSIAFEASSGSVQARQARKLGALILSEGPLTTPDPAKIASALLDGIRRHGPALLPWTVYARQFRARVALLADLEGADSRWPVLDDANLIGTLDDWLGPYLADRRSVADLAKLDLAQILRGRLDRDQQRSLDALAPTHIIVPSGSRMAIDYCSEGTPVLRVKLQELFGLGQTPSIARGRITLQLQLLSPALRPIQVTSDLPGFWAGSYKDVRADLRGRYPKHAWPEDPMSAAPTARAKPRKT